MSWSSAGPNPELSLEPGMTAAVTVTADPGDNVLRTPDQALRYSPGNLKADLRTPPDGSSRLWILRAGKPTAIPIQFGLDDGIYTEIVKGDLQPGDELIIEESGGVLEKPTEHPRESERPDPSIGERAASSRGWLKVNS
jgi:HlyD family secretion protein